MPELQALLDRLERADGLGMMRFGVCQGKGFITSNSEEAIRLLCEVWNKRADIAAALRKGE